jgi:predicted MFS family arabinose efflux permease
VEPDVWLVGAGYFACGFTDQFVGLHWIALLVERGLSDVVAASFLSLLLISGIAGSVLSGPLADHWPPHLLLAGGYLLRAACFPLLLVAGPGIGLAALAIFAVLFGSTYISNQAPGTRLMRDHHGMHAVGRLMSNIGLAHQIGGAVGIGMGGLSVSLAGGYAPAIWLSACVALVGGFLQFGVPRVIRIRTS